MSDSTNSGPRISIRTRTEGDLAPMIAVMGRVYEKDGYPVGVTDAMQFLNSDAILQTWAAEVEGEVVGQASICRGTDENLAVAAWHRDFPDDSLAVLGRLFVDPGSRGSGLAGQLIQQAMEWAENKRVRLVLWVLAKDEGAIRLYKKLGWKQFETSIFHSAVTGKDFDALCFVAPTFVQ